MRWYSGWPWPLMLVILLPVLASVGLTALVMW